MNRYLKGFLLILIFLGVALLIIYYRSYLDRPSIFIPIMFSVSLLLGIFIGYWIYKKKYGCGNISGVLKDPKKLKEELEKQGRFVDGGKILNPTLVESQGKMHLAVIPEKIPLKKDKKKNACSVKKKNNTFFRDALE